MAVLGILEFRKKKYVEISIYCVSVSDFFIPIQNKCYKIHVAKNKIESTVVSGNFV